MTGNRMGSGPKFFLATVLLATIGLGLVWVVAGGTDRPTPKRVADVAGRAAESQSEEDAEEEGATRSAGRYVETYDVFASKDPFEPLVARSAAVSGDGVPAAPEGGVTATFEGGSDDSGLHYTVKVVKVEGRSAVIAIDGQSVSVAVGESFFERFQLLSVADDCASILFGDDQFTLCEGEEIFK